MKTKILLCNAIACFSVLASASAADKSDLYSQKYVVFMDGAPAGRVTVTEKIDENGDRVALVDHDIYIDSGVETNRMAYTTRMVMDKKSLKPKSYVFQYTSGTSGDSYEVLIQGDEITRTLHRGGETSAVTAPYKPDTIILDFIAYHQYEYAIRKYDNKKAGRQIFSDFIPVIGNDIPFAITFLEDTTVSQEKGDLPVKIYRVEFVGLRSGMVTVDRDKRLVLLAMPEQHLEVVREDLAPEKE